MQLLQALTQEPNDEGQTVMPAAGLTAVPPLMQRSIKEALQHLRNQHKAAHHR
jgi:hypothetical protein